MRTTRMLAAALLTGAALLGTAAPALADTPSPSATKDKDKGAPTVAGTTFRTATPVEQGQKATADASSGDYLYWVFPADAGQRPAVDATVTLPSTGRQQATTWRIDVYDGLRRRQPCMYGAQSRAAAADATTVALSCTLRPVRAWADSWSTDPLPGSYYVRLTAVGLPATERGLPVKAELRATTKETGGSQAVDGSLSTPLGAGGPKVEPEDGWSSGWWTDRWIWTGAGGVLAALAGVGGYALTRGRGRPAHVPRNA
ncbi:hypothetical protein [Streptomyces sp. cg36]|uniref:hypothetical protein n=1 Tax=Streptomyces sp. cg36 TaxID=3238798 RepID=UPI0034E2154B